MFPVNSTSEQKVLISLNPTTAAGNPATVDGAPVWSVIEGDCTLEVAADGLSCYLISGAANVVNQVSVTADADLDGGEVREISELIVYAVLAPEATALGLNAAVENK
jgi:hypothetical protein